MLELSWASRTHTGHRRARNEDSILARAELFAVADGMGGHAAGDLASRWAVEALDGVATAGPITRLSVLDAIRGADDRLRSFARRQRADIGTTLCALAVLDAAGVASGLGLGLVNIGDSRAYRLRAGRLGQLTRDHSVVQELLEQGAIGAGDVATHPQRHIITRSLGGDDHLDIDWWPLEPVVGDRYLLATDGLTKEVTDEEIRTIAITEPDVHRTADALIAAALTGGGRDNVSVIVIDVVRVDRPAAASGIADPLDEDTRPRARRHALDADTTPAGPRR